jgi:hypothetical protein
MLRLSTKNRGISKITVATTSENTVQEIEVETLCEPIEG